MNTAFWTENQVGGPYKTLQESAAAIVERALKYPQTVEWMPTNQRNKTVLDYGCGPGHDTILFCTGGAGHVFYYDISPTALEETDRRLDLHGLADRASPTDMFWLPPVDHIHCAGVLHHTEDPMHILKQFRSVLKPTGEVRVMIYDGDRSKHSQSQVPITNWWTRDEFGAMALSRGFREEYLGSYPCSAPWRPDCYAACYRLTCLA